MTAKISLFIVFVEVIIYLLLYNLHDCTFKVLKISTHNVLSLFILIELLPALFTNCSIVDSQLSSKNLRALCCKFSIMFNDFADGDVHKLSVQQSFFNLIRKHFPVFQVIYYRPTIKIMLTQLVHNKYSIWLLRKHSRPQHLSSNLHLQAKFLMLSMSIPSSFSSTITNFLKGYL